MTDTATSTTDDGAAAVDDDRTKQDPGARLGTQRQLGSVGMPVGPVNHLAEERTRLAGLTWQAFDVERVGTTLGAEVRGLDLTTGLDAAVIDELRQALYA